MLMCILQSCITQKKCNERYPPEIYQSDSILIVKHDTIIYDTITIPGDSVSIHDTIPCPELEYHREITKNHISAHVDISKGKISVECHEDEIRSFYQKKIEALRESRIRYIEKKIINKQDIPFVPWYLKVIIIILCLTNLWFMVKTVFKK